MSGTTAAAALRPNRETSMTAVHASPSRLWRALAVALALTAVFAAPSRAADNPNWKAEWDKTVAAANKEGALTVSGPSGRLWRDQLMTFQKAYPKIKLSITPFASRDFWPRVVKEREAGLYLWDIRIGGGDTPSYALKNKGEMAPVRPLLLLPEVTDSGKWIGGSDAMYLDNEKKYFLFFLATSTESEYYNNKKIKASDSPTVQTLIDPKWSGKISIADPRAGSSLNTLTVLDKLYGDDYIRKFLANKPVITKDPRQQIDWLSSGRYPIAYGLPNAPLVEYAQSGGRIADFTPIPGLRVWSPGVGGIQIPSKGPHPNATKVFVNWLLTRDVQARISKAVKLNSLRNDVPLGSPKHAIDTAHWSEYVGTQLESLQPYSVKVTRILRETLQ